MVFVDDFDELFFGRAFCLLVAFGDGFLTVCYFLHNFLSFVLRPSSFPLLVTYFLFRAAPRGERAAVHGGKRGPATAVWERAAMRGGKHGL